jgi:2-keto-4-pentenoate hydratase/2-oxohepta-3-ene-1,7-dioic acid hydratase in catechol pathway
MRLARFGNSGSGHRGQGLGVVDGDRLRDVSPALDVLPSYRYPLPAVDPLIAHFSAISDRISTLLPSAPVIPLSDVTLLAPVANPGKIVAAPVNYQKHLDEARGDEGLHHQNQINTIHKAGLFLKATSALAGAGEGVALRKLERRNDYEIELAFVIGRTAQSVGRRDALDYVAGYAIGLDITIRGGEERSLRKSADSYAVLGPWLTTADEVGSPDDLELRLSVNGELRQCSRTSYLTLKVAELVEFASSFFTLHPGDVFFTGTPEGVGPIFPGDVIDAAIERVGSMRVHVRAAEERTTEGQR